MHFRGTRIGETYVHATRDQSPHQTFRTVHHSAPVREAAVAISRSTIVPGIRQRGLAHPPTSTAQGFLTALSEISDYDAVWLAKSNHCSQSRSARWKFRE